MKGAGDDRGILPVHSTTHGSSYGQPAGSKCSPFGTSHFQRLTSLIGTCTGLRERLERQFLGNRRVTAPFQSKFRLLESARGDASTFARNLPRTGLAFQSNSNATTLWAAARTTSCIRFFHACERKCRKPSEGGPEHLGERRINGAPRTITSKGSSDRQGKYLHLVVSSPP